MANAPTTDTPATLPEDQQLIDTANTLLTNARANRDTVHTQVVTDQTTATDATARGLGTPHSAPPPTP